MKSNTIRALDLRLGMVIFDEDWQPCRVQHVEIRPPTTTYLMMALVLRPLEKGAERKVWFRADKYVELAPLQEDEAECLYLTDQGFVVFDPVASLPVELHRSAAIGYEDSVRPGLRVALGYWRGRPVTLRPLLECK